MLNSKFSIQNSELRIQHCRCWWA